MTANDLACKICGDDNPKEGYRTGKVRGVICDKCNKMLGLAKDNILTLQMAIHYLSRHYLNRQPVEGEENHPKPEEEWDDED